MLMLFYNYYNCYDVSFEFTVYFKISLDIYGRSKLTFHRYFVYV
jgi:hypothetical protein